jgi:hypothetical protein
LLENKFLDIFNLQSITVKTNNMSRLGKYSSKATAEVNEHNGAAVTNFMAGNSFKLNAIDTLRIVAASSIFGEPQYYRDGLDSKKTVGKSISSVYDILGVFEGGKTAVDVFTSSIDAALSHDFGATLELAKSLRHEYNMRLNPAVIYVRATLHKNRLAFNEKHPGVMKAIGKSIAGRPDDLTNQFDYFMYVNGTKKGMPSLLKRTWAERLEEYSRYQLNKYKGKKLIDLVRLSHANNDDINELMKTGTLKVTETEQTWETLRSAGKSWKEIMDTIKIPHMALLRNLRGIFSEIKDATVAQEVINQLKAGVLTGKQFPFRYYSAYKAIEKEGTVNHKTILLDGLEECMDIAVENMPKLSGTVACLSDNSGSAWGAVTSEYGTTQVAEIANLSSLITAQRADEGFVGVFGDNLSLKGVSKRNGLLGQLKETSTRGKAQGGGTENGIWIFWDDAIKNKKHYDTVFIYSDMQAGHGNLYGVNKNAYAEFIHPTRGGSYIDVLALVAKYRKTVNPKVNIFSVQVAGYDNAVLPENLYRGAILAGWTGKESIYAKAIIDTWDSIESPKQ